MRTRTVLLGALAWLGVVAAGSGVTWVVIDAAGQQVLSEAPVAGTRGSTPAAVVPTGSPSASARAHRTHRVRPSGTTAPTPTSGPVPRPSARPSPTPSTHEPEPAPGGEQRTWRGAAGTVVARCTGRTVTLVSATPSDGYQVEVGSRGPDEVEVTFKGGGAETQVKARCSDGTPRFEVDAESEHESDAAKDDGGGER